MRRLFAIVIIVCGLAIIIVSLINWRIRPYAVSDRIVETVRTASDGEDETAAVSKSLLEIEYRGALVLLFLGVIVVSSVLAVYFGCMAA